jgi:putative cell wall-binding protein
MASTPSSTSPTPTGRGIIAGVVTGSDGAPAVGVTVWLSGRASLSTITDQTGAFEFIPLSPGRYSLLFMCSDACEGSYRLEHLGDTQDQSSQEWVDLAAGQRVNVGVELERRGGIGGTVRGDDGAPLRGVRVSVIEPDRLEDGRFGEAVTDEHGRYHFRNLADGEYTLWFGPRDPATHFGEYWNDSRSDNDATPVVVRNAEIVDDIDATLTRTAWISGRVVNEDGVRFGSDADVYVLLYRVTPEGRIEVDSTSLGMYPLPDGAYSFRSVEAGTYVLKTWSLEWGSTLYGVSEWWPDTQVFESATRIVVGAGDRFEANIVMEGGPVSLSGPRVTGEMRVGQTLTAAASSLTPGAQLAYQWYAGEDPIEGATASTYTLTPSELRKYVTVEVTATAVERWPEKRRTYASSAVEPMVLIAGEPTISGSGRVDATLTAHPGTWTPGTEFTYQWRADGTAIQGATQPSLLLTPAQAGKRVSVAVVGSKPAHETHQRVSREIGVSHGPAELSQPVIEGTPEVGSTLAASASSATPGAVLSFDWFGNGRINLGAGESLELTEEHQGHAISVRVRVRAPGYSDTLAESTATAAVRYPHWGDVSRIAGADRYETAALISAATFDPGVPVVYVASGANFPDALAGAPVAGDAGGPVLLSTVDALPDSVITELERLQPERIVILGGTPSISATVEADLNEIRPDAVSRIAGADRFETSAVISASRFGPGVPVAYVASAADFPDALAGAPVAAVNGGPILLTTADDLPDVVEDELIRLQPQRIVVLGGSPSVGASVEAELSALRPGAVSRIAGEDRFQTAARIADSQFSPGSVPVAYVASAMNFPDALAGAPVAGVTGGPVLLAATERLPDSTLEALHRLRPERIVVLGGPPSIGLNVESQLRSLN